jgi:UDP-galactopyranose mutase
VESSSPKDKNRTCSDIAEDLRKMGFVGGKDELIASNAIDIPYAYPIFTLETKKALQTIHEFLVGADIFSIGRYGAWDYSFIEKNIIDAMEIAKTIDANRPRY